MQNYLVLLFKNKKKNKIIKKFVSLTRAKTFFEKVKKNSDDVIFDVKIENGIEVSYELCLMRIGNTDFNPVYKKDDIGRNVRVVLEDDGMTMINIYDFKKEEKIFDLQIEKRITLNEFVKSYLRKNELKVVSILNNKIIVQQDDKVFIFSTKNENESIRFVDCLSSSFITQKRTDCIFVTDTSTPQKKYLMKILTDYGFDDKILYRTHTTYPRRKE